ncbi:hypothetical protein TKK_0013432 [Trichogramma kaykai]|uniref:Ubiquitin carboxyl-terminal hydrolase n=1 Tax=Trichogramma kaykai TaxID=54128 RepID=A0ABD2WHV6_9HYME
MSIEAVNCPHSESHGNFSIVEEVFTHKEIFSKCSDCDNEGPNLWLCLYPGCRYVGCAEQHLDHSTIHNRKFPSHSAHMNLSSTRIWCYSCEAEVLTRNTNSPSPRSSDQMDQKHFSLYNKYSGDASINMDTKSDTDEYLNDQLLFKKLMANRGEAFIDKPEDSPDSTDSDEGRDYMMKPTGLVGLQNIGNTCYMNSALQALSNVPPLTQYFLSCDDMVSYIGGDKKPGLSLSYLHLIKEMWDRRARGFTSPHNILTGIRTVHPMFRGYHQHDTQEFLRCFMDQLHEELKVYEEDRESVHRLKSLGDQPSSDDEEPEVDGTASSQSDGEYETCDSGVSEQSSLSDEGERGQKRRYSRPNQPDKLRNKFTNRSLKKVSVDVAFLQQQQRSSPNSPTKHRTKKQSKMRSIISDIFDGKLLSSVQCLTCDRVSTRVETFQDLSLPIPSRDHMDILHQGSITPQKAGPCSDVVYVANQPGWLSWIFQWFRSWFWGPTVDLHHCLSAFFSADELKGDNMYSCEKCNKLRNGVKYSKVLELPEMLCVHLKRFRHELMFSSKIASHVSFPSDSIDMLDMRPYLHKDCVSKVTTYELISVICHHGTAGGGHYVCYAFNPMANQWFEFDDQCVTPVSLETVRNCGAYVLFYKKYSPEMHQIREKTAELMEISSKTSTDLNFFVSRQWINRFNSFAEPGPIDNSDFLCPHGGVIPARAKFVEKLCTPLPQTVWEYLYQTFGGGPACTQLYECPHCEEKFEQTEKRRCHELEVFNQLNRPDNPTALYALSMSWFRQWQNFVKNRETPPPGPIENNSIAVNKGGLTVLKLGSDYGPIPEELWQFFIKTYGGGPEVMLTPNQRSMTMHSNISPHSATSLSGSPQDAMKFGRVESRQKQAGTATKVVTATTSNNDQPNSSQLVMTSTAITTSLPSAPSTAESLSGVTVQTEQSSGPVTMPDTTCATAVDLSED